MRALGSRYLDPLKRPEYTGENRCLPCTILNVVLASLGSLLLGSIAVELGVAVLGLSLLVIYLRGYLIPGTPTLTKRYVPRPVLTRVAGHRPPGERTDRDDWETLEKLAYEKRNAVDPERFLTEAGAIEPSESGEDVRLTDGFVAHVERLMAAHRDEPMNRAVIADMFDVDPHDVERQPRDYPAVKIERRIRKWPSEGALVADIATHEALSDRTDRWLAVPFEQRRRILESLRGLHPSCPLCSGDIRYLDDVVESCCAQYEVTRIACTACGERLLEFDPTKVGTEAVRGLTP